MKYSLKALSFSGRDRARYMWRSIVRTLVVPASCGIAALLLAEGGVVQPVQADTVAKELVGYRNLQVRLDDDAADCDLDARDKEIHTHAVSALGKLDLLQRADAQVDAALVVSNVAFGALDVECALHVELSFFAGIPSENITGVNEGTRAALDRVGVLPVTLWDRKIFGVAARTAMTSAEAKEKPFLRVIEMTDKLIEDLKTERQ